MNRPRKITAAPELDRPKGAKRRESGPRYREKRATRAKRKSQFGLSKPRFRLNLRRIAIRRQGESKVRRFQRARPIRLPGGTQQRDHRAQCPVHPASTHPTTLRPENKATFNWPQLSGQDATSNQNFCSRSLKKQNAGRPTREDFTGMKPQEST